MIVLFDQRVNHIHGPFHGAVDGDSFADEFPSIPMPCRTAFTKSKRRVDRYSAAILFEFSPQDAVRRELTEISPDASPGSLYDFPPLP